MASIVNIEHLKTLTRKDKIFMVQSRRDERLGSVVRHTDNYVILKMENIEQFIKVDYKVFSEGFTFIFSKRQGVLSWWAVKYKRAVLPNLSSMDKLWYCTQSIYDSLTKLHPTLSNEDIFSILKNYRNSLIDGYRKHKSAC